MEFINAKIFNGEGFVPGSFETKNGRFSRVLSLSPDSAASEEVIDLEGKIVIPGLIDVHGHGNSGFDFSTCDLDGLRRMAEYLGSNGITAFAPASMTMPYSTLEKAYSNAAALHKAQALSLGKESKLVGINMEGPFFSYGKRGAQDPQYLKLPDIESFKKLNETAEGLIKLADVAPELEGAMEFIQEISKICTVSAAHTEADYETTIKAFEQGATHMTHLFNGMNGIGHRNPGPAAAAFDTPGVYVELICDGVHIKPPVIRMVFNLFRGRVVLISDALACCGMPDGKYALGDQTVTLNKKYATLPDGTLAGSASNLFDMLKNVISYGVDPVEAVNAATINPAHQLGLDNELGSISEGKAADFVVCTDGFDILDVFINGEKL